MMGGLGKVFRMREGMGILMEGGDVGDSKNMEWE